METLPVTLIVKAPNQQIEDQTIKCESTWTINKLKQHLSEVYPSKPAKHEQKLIYSGQLLGDSDVLKDVLRQYDDGHDIHTVHLVCTPKYYNPKTKEYRPEPVRSTPRPPQNDPPRATEQVTVTPVQIPNPPEQRVPNMQWVNTAPMDPAQYAMHLAWMQQAYIQYMNQYLQLAANPYVTRNVPTPATQPNVINPEAAQQANPVGQREPAARPRPAPLQRDPENPERDWLDVFYLLSRVIVLFSVVYFYSSPLRFLFVLLIGFSFYLYQIGFFRNMNNNNNNNNTVPADPLQQEEQAPSRLMVVWTFFTTFFASLVPEIPNAI